METAGLFTVALGLQAPWAVSDVRFEPTGGEIHFDVRCQARRLPCPACGAGEQRQRAGEHLVVVGAA